MKTIISNPKQFKRIVKNIKKDGVKNLHILTDFDKTLTYNFVKGKEVQSVIAILRDEKYLTPNYPALAQKLADKYIPIEDNPKIPKSEKNKAMLEWWSKHLNLLIKSKLSIKDIQKAVSSKKIRLRNGVKDFLKTMNKNQIPVIIISAAGLGKDSIKMILQKNNIDYKNIHIVSNGFIWNKKGAAIGINKPIIHSLNKDETILKSFGFYKNIKNRENVALLGDGLDDIDMLGKVKHKNVIKIGFLNKDVNSRLKYYKKAFDLVITGDADFKGINSLIKKMI